MRYLKLAFTLLLFGLMYALAATLIKLRQAPYNATFEVLMFTVAFWELALIALNANKTTLLLREFPASKVDQCCTFLANCLAVINLVLGLYLVTLWNEKTTPNPQLSYLILGFSSYIIVCAVLFWIRPKVPVETLAVVYNKIFLPGEFLPVYLIFLEKITLFSEKHKLEIQDCDTTITTKQGGIGLKVRAFVRVGFAGGNDRYCNPDEIYLMGQEKIIAFIRSQGSLSLSLGEVIDSIRDAKLTFQVCKITVTWSGQDAEITIPSKDQAAY